TTRAQLEKLTQFKPMENVWFWMTDQGPGGKPYITTASSESDPADFAASIRDVQRRIHNPSTGVSGEITIAENRRFLFTTQGNPDDGARALHQLRALYGDAAAPLKDACCVRLQKGKIQQVGVYPPPLEAEDLKRLTALGQAQKEAQVLQIQASDAIDTLQQSIESWREGRETAYAAFCSTVIVGLRNEHNRQQIALQNLIAMGTDRRYLEASLDGFKSFKKKANAFKKRIKEFLSRSISPPNRVSIPATLKGDFEASLQMDSWKQPAFGLADMLQNGAGYLEGTPLQFVGDISARWQTPPAKGTYKTADDQLSALLEDAEQILSVIHLGTQRLKVKYEREQKNRHDLEKERQELEQVMEKVKKKQETGRLSETERALAQVKLPEYNVQLKALQEWLDNSDRILRSMQIASTLQRVQTLQVRWKEIQSSAWVYPQPLFPKLLDAFGGLVEMALATTFLNISPQNYPKVPETILEKQEKATDVQKYIAVLQKLEGISPAQREAALAELVYWKVKAQRAKQFNHHGMRLQFLNVLDETWASFKRQSRNKKSYANKIEKAGVLRAQITERYTDAKEVAIGLENEFPTLLDQLKKQYRLGMRYFDEIVLDPTERLSDMEIVMESIQNTATQLLNAKSISQTEGYHSFKKSLLDAYERYSSLKTKLAVVRTETLYQNDAHTIQLSLADLLKRLKGLPLRYLSEQEHVLLSLSAANTTPPTIIQRLDRLEEKLQQIQNKSAQTASDVYKLPRLQENGQLGPPESFSLLLPVQKYEDLNLAELIEVQYTLLDLERLASEWRDLALLQRKVPSQKLTKLFTARKTWTQLLSLYGSLTADVLEQRLSERIFSKVGKQPQNPVQIQKEVQACILDEIRYSQMYASSMPPKELLKASELSYDVGKYLKAFTNSKIRDTGAWQKTLDSLRFLTVYMSERITETAEQQRGSVGCMASVRAKIQGAVQSSVFTGSPESVALSETSASAEQSLQKLQRHLYQTSDILNKLQLSISRLYKVLPRLKRFVKDIKNAGKPKAVEKARIFAASVASIEKALEYALRFIVKGLNEVNKLFLFLDESRVQLEEYAQWATELRMLEEEAMSKEKMTRQFELLDIIRAQSARPVTYNTHLTLLETVRKEISLSQSYFA
ncbi:MAG: hypothetical protein VX278_11360, partial [Myxococcota bacterium]|nr:hypothetical protein [Myxococcota bacterium]